MARPEHQPNRGRRHRDTDEDADEAATDLTPPVVLAAEPAAELLEHGEISVEGQVVDASNATLYVRVEHAGVFAAAAYKPVSGERALWDFPDGTLAEREAAAFAVSAASGWDVVPPTVLRDGPFGLGMLQLWVQTDDSVDVRSVIRAGGPELRRIALFDAVINNGDRKGGHLLPVTSGRVWGIDHGVSFNVEDKLRTVLWNWAGDPLDDDEVEALFALRERVNGELGDQLAELLTGAEVRRTRGRIDRLLRSGCLPQPSRSWPPVPWPPM